MQVKVYVEFQGTGSPHADKHGNCWCGQEQGGDWRVEYLKATNEAAAIEEAAAKFGVPKAEINKVVKSEVAKGA